MIPLRERASLVRLYHYVLFFPGAFLFGFLIIASPELCSPHGLLLATSHEHNRYYTLNVLDTR